MSREAKIKFGEDQKPIDKSNHILYIIVSFILTPIQRKEAQVKK